MKYLITFLASLCLLSAHGQVIIDRSVVSTAGSTTSSGNFILNYSIGELAVATIGQSPIFTEGFEQSDVTTTGLQNTYDCPINIALYPNPVRSTLQIQISTSTDEELFFQLHDMQGRLLTESRSIFINAHSRMSNTIDMTALADGVYMLSVLDNQKKKLTEPMRIVKTH